MKSLSEFLRRAIYISVVVLVVLYIFLEKPNTISTYFFEILIVSGFSIFISTYLLESFVKIEDRIIATEEERTAAWRKSNKNRTDVVREEQRKIIGDSYDKRLEKVQESYKKDRDKLSKKIGDSYDKRLEKVNESYKKDLDKLSRTHTKELIKLNAELSKLKKQNLNKKW